MEVTVNPGHSSLAENGNLWGYTGVSKNSEVKMHMGPTKGLELAFRKAGLSSHLSSLFLHFCYVLSFSHGKILFYLSMKDGPLTAISHPKRRTLSQGSTSAVPGKGLRRDSQPSARQEPIANQSRQPEEGLRYHMLPNGFELRGGASGELP